MQNNIRFCSLICKNQKRFRMNYRRIEPAIVLILAAVFTVTLGLMQANAQLPNSYTPTSFVAGASPTAGKIADLDSDGFNDIAVVNLQGSLQLFFNNGAGSFNRVSLNGVLPSSANTLDIDIGDLNGDGRKDLAVAFTTQTGSIAVLLNQGNRTFSAPVIYNTCNSSKGVAIGDLDGDGDLDIADISQCNKAGILINNGQGSFTFRGTVGDGYNSKSVGLADFNRDGLNDIAYVNNGVGLFRTSSVTVLLNQGNATFGAPAFYNVGDGPEDLALGDVNADGYADIAVAATQKGETWMLYNSGSGTFPAMTFFFGNGAPNRIAMGDFTNDGLPEIAVTTTNNNLLVFVNQNGYDFYDTNFINFLQSPSDVAVGHLNGDTYLDVVGVNQGNGSIVVLLSDIPPPPPMTLTATTRSEKNAKYVDLRWSGVPGASVEIYRNGTRITTVPNNGSYTDQHNKNAKGTFLYRVCVPGSGGQCSNMATISF